MKFFSVVLMVVVLVLLWIGWVLMMLLVSVIDFFICRWCCVVSVSCIWLSSLFCRFRLNWLVCMLVSGLKCRWLVVVIIVFSVLIWLNIVCMLVLLVRFICMLLLCWLV